MIRLPNKLYPFAETVLADFTIVLRGLNGEAMTVVDLHHRLKDTIDTQDFIEALTLMLALRTLDLDLETGVIRHA